MSYQQVLSEFMDFIAARTYTLSNGRKVTFLIETWDYTLEHHPSKYTRQLHEDCSAIQLSYIQEATANIVFNDNALVTSSPELKKLADEITEE